MQDEDRVINVPREYCIKPSWFVKRARRYLNWCNVNQCKECGLTGKYEDLHNVNPCPECGNRSIAERTGRWIPDKIKLWEFWNWSADKGYWQIKKYNWEK